MPKINLPLSNIMLVFSFLFFTVVAHADLQADYQRLEQDNHIIHIVKVDPSQFSIKLVSSSEPTLKRETLLQLAHREKASIAINAGFFGIGQNNQAYPSGVFKVNGKWVSGSSIPRAALGWSSKEIIFDNIIVKPELHGYKAQGQRSSHESWEKMTYVVGGAPLLIARGNIIKDYKHEKIRKEGFISEPHARTALGLTEQGLWVLVVAEQRFEFKSGIFDLKFATDYIQQKRPLKSYEFKNAFEITAPGLTLPELARLMKEQGCEWAINLDGGGSTGLFYDGKILTKIFNHMADLQHGFSRKIHNAIVFVSRDHQSNVDDRMND